MQILKVKSQKNGYLVNDDAFVPSNPDNSDFQRVSKWISEGGVVEDEFSLAEIKAQKIAKIKAIRDEKNIEPITDTSAEILNEDGSSSGVRTFFVFHTSRHPTNPAADPQAILSGVIIMNQTLPYSTKDISGAKVTIALTPAIARSIAAHLSLRNSNNYKLADAIVVAINAAETQEAVEGITWGVDYL